MDDERGRAILCARGGGAGHESGDVDTDGLVRLVRVVLRPSKREDRDAIEDVLERFSREDERDEHAGARRARGLSEMVRSPE